MVCGPCPRMAWTAVAGLILALNLVSTPQAAAPPATVDVPDDAAAHGLFDSMSFAGHGRPTGGWVRRVGHAIHV